MADSLIGWAAGAGGEVARAARAEREGVALVDAVHVQTTGLCRVVGILRIIINLIVKTGLSYLIISMEDLYASGFS